MKSRTWLYLIFAGLLPGISAPATAQEPLHLSLEEAVDIALEKNLGLRSTRLGVQIQEQGVAVETARFGRSLDLSLFRQSNRSPSFSSLEEVETLSSTILSTELGVTQQLRTGGQLGLRFSNNRNASNAAYNLIDPIYSSGLNLNFTQPLLQGRGRISRIGVDLAQVGVEQSQVETERRARTLRAEVGQSYWNLLFARENLRVKEQFREGARRVLETVKVRADMGVDSHSSILQAEVEVARREEEVVAAEGAAAQAEDALKSLLNLEQHSESLVLTAAPELSPFAGDLDQGIAQALSRDPEYRQVQLALKNLELQLALARDQVRPSVSLNAAAGLSGLGGSYGDDLKVLKDLDARSWQGSLALEFPLGESPADQRLGQRRLEKERRAVDLEHLRQQLEQQVRQRFRQVGIDRRRAEVAQLAEELAGQNVAEEEERLKLGLSTARQVLDAQDDLAQARATRLRAVVDYNQSLIE
ncbi:MAG: TolC family protein, partial [Candidatus Latescibacteria bacterium]|nr:TolC family protein [Candidatus Latescibacterota bacterium]